MNQTTENNFQEVGGQSNNKQWKPQDPTNFANPAYPKEIIGYFKSTSERIGPNGPFNIAVITRINPTTGEHEDFDVSGGSVLDGKLEEIQLGSFVKIIYEGKVPSKTPGRTYNVWKTFVDPNAVKFSDLGGVTTKPVAPVANTQANPFNPVVTPVNTAKTAPPVSSAPITKDPFASEDLPF